MNRTDQRQTCKVCGRPDKFDFSMPDRVWRAIVPEEFVNRVVCLYCFDDFAFMKGKDYASFLRLLYFAGDAATFVFRAETIVGPSKPCHMSKLIDQDGMISPLCAKSARRLSLNRSASTFRWEAVTCKRCLALRPC